MTPIRHTGKAERKEGRRIGWKEEGMCERKKEGWMKETLLMEMSG